MSILVLAFLLGVVSGLRTLTAPAAASWAARYGLLHLQATPLAFLGDAFTPWIFTLVAIGELVSDKLPKTPSRTVPPQFIIRILSGAFVGAAIGATSHALWLGLIAGALGAVAGTLGGAFTRARLAASFGRDLPAALLEDVVAILLAIVVVTRAA
jgi:uncharacterized membrane protein